MLSSIEHFKIKLICYLLTQSYQSRIKRKTKKFIRQYLTLVLAVFFVTLSNPFKLLSFHFCKLSKCVDFSNVYFTLDNQYKCIWSFVVTQLVPDNQSIMVTTGKNSPLIPTHAPPAKHGLACPATLVPYTRDTCNAPPILKKEDSFSKHD